MQTPRKLIESILKDGDLEISFAQDYAEPGYSVSPDCPGILFANWNETSRWVDGQREVVDRTMPRLAKIAEHAGYAVEWSDEWACCSYCYRAVRTSPDSYGWQSGYHYGDGEICCRDCLDPADYLASIDGDEHSAVTFADIDPEQHGYVLVKAGMEHGFHPGQNDSPKVVAADLRQRGVHRFLFKIDRVQQFDMDFSVYVHADEAQLVGGEPASALPYDPGTEMGKALRGERSAHVQMVTVELTPQEFIAGKF